MIQHPMFAAIWVDYDDTETECEHNGHASTMR